MTDMSITWCSGPRYGLCHFTSLNSLPRLFAWWRHQMETFPRYWPFVRAIHRSSVNSPHKGQWRGALMYSLICARINGWENNGEVGDLRRHRAHYDVIVMAHCICNSLLVASRKTTANGRFVWYGNHAFGNLSYRWHILFKNTAVDLFRLLSINCIQWTDHILVAWKSWICSRYHLRMRESLIIYWKRERVESVLDITFVWESHSNVPTYM